MLDQLISSVSGTDITSVTLFINTLASLIIGLGAAMVYMFRNKYSKSFVVTLALLPAMVQIVIMIVNGNIGTGIAVMGAFSLVRFRSVPGSAREIGSIFFAMALGLATGTGYVLYAFMFLVVVGGMTLILIASGFGEKKSLEKELKITLPEHLNYEGLLDDVLADHTLDYSLMSIKTTNMGSLFELTYHLTFKRDINEKSFIDALRCRNGNLSIQCSRMTANREEL